MYVFSVFDSKADAYLLPFFSRNRGVALRQFMTAVQDEKTDFHRYAGDYTLFEIGTWDDESGTLAEHKAKVNLGVAIQFLGGSEPVPITDPAIREVS